MENSFKQTQSKKKKWLWWGVGIIIIIVIISISSDSKDKTTPVQNNIPIRSEQNQKDTKNTIYQLSGSGKSVSDNKITVEGKTNLPDGSILEISVDRVSVWKGEDMERFFTVASSDTVVNNGVYKTEINIDDRKLLEFEKNSGEIIKEMNKDVEVSIIFNPSIKQPQNVINIIGNKGQRLESSSQKKVFGSATPNPVNRLDINFRVEAPFPFMNELPK
ncbi:MAG TPA: hypothetical protein ENI63_00835 [Candidatus Kaiserbacteria bacterium]|nr:hypothetical protein [Candidatus Kaiserbacteria bacterium]